MNRKTNDIVDATAAPTQVDPGTEYEGAGSMDGGVRAGVFDSSPMAVACSNAAGTSSVNFVHRARTETSVVRRSQDQRMLFNCITDPKEFYPFIVERFTLPHLPPCVHRIIMRVSYVA